MEEDVQCSQIKRFPPVVVSRLQSWGEKLCGMAESCKTERGSLARARDQTKLP